jgi:4'-phosphopantetheinyl transferase
MASTDARELSQENIQVWTFPSTAPDDTVAALLRVLNTEETERAARFQFAHLRDSFVVAHGVLRFLLGRYMRIDPAKIQFSFNSKGKPVATEANGIKFNMTHSGGLTVIALAMECEIGVDVEKIRPLSDLLQIAERHFCQEEAAELRSVPSEQRENAFFRCWTRKEAYLKAIGAGLSAPLNGFRVPVDPKMVPRFIHINHDIAEANVWELHDLNVGFGYAAALAYRARRRALFFFPIDDFKKIVTLA